MATNPYDSLLTEVGEFGPYQKWVYFLLCLACIQSPLTSSSVIFENIEPDFRCAVPGLPNDTFAIQNDYHERLVNASIPLDDSTQRYSGLDTYRPIIDNGLSNDGLRFLSNETVECHRWVYSREQLTTSLVADLNLVSYRKSIKNHLTMVVLLGMLVGSLVGGSLSDYIGRKKTIILSLIGQAACNTSIAFINTVPALMVLRCLSSVCLITSFMAAFVLITELLGPKERKSYGMGTMFFYSFGMILVLPVFYFIRVWRTAQLVISIPCFLFTTYCWLIPESPRWLLTKGRRQEALKILEKICESNGTKLAENLESTLFSVEADKEPERKGQQKSIRPWHLFTNRIMLLRFIILCFNWVTNSFVYFGLTLCVGDVVEGNIYLNYGLIAIMEFTAYLVVVLLMKRIGRKWLYCGSILMSGISCMATMGPVLTESDEKWINVVLSSIGKLGVTGAFSVLYFLTAEMLPTVLRNSGVGFCSLVGRIGGLTSPYIATIGDLVPGLTGRILPLTIFGGSAVVSGIVSLVLPETRNKRLPETIEDAINFGR